MYKVLAAMHMEMNEGWAWVTNEGFPPRSVIKIKNKNNRKVVYCEYLEIDPNFREVYNNTSKREKIDLGEKTIVLNGWYRKRLGGISTKSNYDLKITQANGWWGRFRVCTDHPQVVVRFSIKLAVISVGLAALSVCLAVLSIWMVSK